MDPGVVLFVRNVLFPSLLPSQAALYLLECSEALMILLDCFMHLSLKLEKKKKEKRGEKKKWNQSCMLGKGIPTYHRLKFSEVFLDLYGSQYAK